MEKPIFLFDLGGTLMEGPDKSPAKRFVHELGLKEEDKDILTNFLFTEHITNVKTLIERFNYYFPHLKKEDHKKIKNVWESQFTEGYPLPGAFDLIKKLSQDGCKLGIISNMWHPFFLCYKKIFQEYIDLFLVKTLSYQAKIKKPNIKIFENTIKAFEKENSLKPENFCMIGDSYYNDMEPALKMNLKTIWILHKPQREIIYLNKIKNRESKQPHIMASTVEFLANDGYSLIETLF